MALMQLSAGLIGKRANHVVHDVEVNATEKRSTNPDDIHRESVNIYTISSRDSGIEVDDDININLNQEAEPPKQPRARANSIVKTDSTSSLPLELESQEQIKMPHNKRKLFIKARSLTRPELRRVSTMERQSMRDLILQAVMILHEAHSDGSALDLTEH